MSKKITFILIIIVCTFIPFFSVAAQTDNYSIVLLDQVGDGLCTEQSTIKALRFVGYIIITIKIAIPLIIIVVGSFDFSKSVTGKSQDEIKKSAISLLKRSLIGMSIFFLPAVINILLNALGNGEQDEDYSKCTECLFAPEGDNCKEQE